jgi:dephospho-CoA kinase
VLDTPLLTVTEGHEFAGLIVVDTPVDVAIDRLVTQRGMAEEDARARIAKQISRDERLAKADHVVDNGGTVEQLDAQVDDLWTWLQTLAAG